MCGSSPPKKILKGRHFTYLEDPVINYVDHTNIFHAQSFFGVPRKKSQLVGGGFKYFFMFTLTGKISNLNDIFLMGGSTTH